MRLLLLALLAFPYAARADDVDDVPAIQRSLAELRLGDSFEDVQRVYAPAQDWPSYIDPRGRVTRYRVDRSAAKSFPAWTEVMLLGFKRGRLVDIQVIYTAKRSSESTYEDLYGEYSLIYGPGARADGKYWWGDGSTVMRVFPAEVPVFKDGVRGSEWRTSIQILDKNLHKRVD